MPKAVAWKSLKHAQGPATRVPEMVKSMCASESATERLASYYELRELLVAPNKWFTAAAAAVALLLDAAGKAKDARLPLALVADILGADSLRAWLEPARAKIAPAAKPAHEKALERRDQLLGWLSSRDLGLRRAAPAVLAMLPGMTECLPSLRKLAAADGDELVRASALLALARLDEEESTIAAALDAPAAVVRGAASLSWLRRDDARHFKQARAGIEGWLSMGEDLAWFVRPPHFQVLPNPETPVTALAAVARQRNKGAIHELVELTLDIGTSGRGSVEIQAAKLLLELGGLAAYDPSEHPVALADELDAEQRAMAKKLAATSLLPAGNYGLPASGDSRRRWIGVLPSGALERTVKIDMAGTTPRNLMEKRRLEALTKAGAMPFWRAFVAAHLASLRGRPFPPQLDALLDGLDRWQAIVEIGAGTYWFRFVMEEEDIDRELERLPQSAELLERAAALADDLAARYVAALRAGTPIVPELPAFALLLLPLVRAGRALEPRWDVLLPLGPERHAREIVAALSAERLAAAMTAQIEAFPEPATIELFLEIADLVPSRAVVDTLMTLLKRLATQSPELKREVAPLEKRVAEAFKDLARGAGPRSSAAPARAPGRRKAGK